MEAASTEGQRRQMAMALPMVLDVSLETGD